MINFDTLENEIINLRERFIKSEPFSHIVIDDFCDEEKLSALLNSFPDPENNNIKKSRDYIFAKNKYEKSDFRNVSIEYRELYSDLTGSRFQNLLKQITGEDVFIDPTFHGGGLHQGGKGSFLDMHVDFNFHPLHQNWFRNLNILLYLNKDWKPEYRGQLRLRHKDSKSTVKISPLFNRCVIMLTRDYTLHGYETINFPNKEYRRSVAAYAYTEIENPVENERSTTWYPENSGWIKSTIGRHWPKLVKIKNKILGSSTEKNK